MTFPLSPAPDPAGTGPASPVAIAGAMPANAWPPLPDDVGAQLLAMQFQFERSQWWSADEIAAAQDRQLDELLAHAGRTVPRYRELWHAAGIDPERVAARDFGALPLVARSDAVDHFAAMQSTAPPPRHGRVYDDSTSGSMGMPLTFRATELHAFYWHALLLREHLWHGREFFGKLAMIRHGVAEGETAGWGGMLDRAVRSGPCATLPIVTDVGRQLDWLERQNPAYLLTYPSNLRTLLQLARQRGTPLPALREMRTFGETLPDDLRALAAAVWPVPLTDVYSSQECGYIALQCPQGDGYHVMAENLRVEVLHPDGRPCAPGETGRVVLTTLHNFAMPLIRYVIGDFAEVGDPCPCGRGLPRLTRIMGRQRNLIRIPDGRHLWPVFGVQTWVQDIPVRQIRFVQRVLDRLEIHYAMDRELAADERETIAARLRQSLQWPFELEWVRCDGIPPGRTGKFEDVVCHLGDSESG